MTLTCVSHQYVTLTCDSFVCLEAIVSRSLSFSLVGVTYEWVTRKSHIHTWLIRMYRGDHLSLSLSLSHTLSIMMGCIPSSLVEHQRWETSHQSILVEHYKWHTTRDDHRDTRIICLHKRDKSSVISSRASEMRDESPVNSSRALWVTHDQRWSSVISSRASEMTLD